MGMGLIGIGRQKANGAMAGFGEVAKTEASRNQAEQTLKANQEAADASMKGTMVSTGAMLGAEYGSVAGIPGMAVGAVAGLLLSDLF